MSRVDGARLGHNSRGGARWVLDAAVVAAGLLAGVLLLASMHLTLSTVDRANVWNRTLGDLRSSAGLSYAWLQAAGRADAPAGAREQVVVQIDSARSACKELLTGAHPVEGAGARTTLRRLCGALTAYRAASARRLGGAARTDEYVASFRRSLAAAEQAERAIGAEVARERRRVLRLDGGLALLVLLVFAAISVAVSRRAKILAVQNERLRRIDRLKDDFVASVSHELRTPLTATIGFLQTLERSDLELSQADRQELTRIARVQAERLARRVTDLLFVSEVVAGKLSLNYTTIDMAALSADCVEALAAAARDQGVALKLEADLVPPLRGDRARLAQLLDNVLSNALKFTPPNGEIRIRARAAAGRAQLEVSDTGIGIPDAEQARLFDRFYRTDEATRRAIPGAGLGLAIVKAIAEAHDGAVSLESQEGHGTTVRVELPLVPA